MWFPFFRPKDEQVMVIPRVQLFGTFDEGAFDGFVHIKDPRAEQFLTTILENHSFAWRNHSRKDQEIPAEQDATLKQIIPYCVIKHGNSYFGFKRLEKATEKRLVNKYAFGVGGHINPLTEHQLNKLVEKFPHTMTDGVLEHTIIEHNMLRELHEEMKLDKYTFKPLGFINNDATDVGKHHFGILYLIELQEPKLSVKEKQKMDGSLLPKPELLALEHEVEGWSKILLQRIKQGLL